MSYYHPAVTNVGKNVLIIKNGAVIGKGTIQVMMGDKFVGVRFEEGEVMAMLENSEVVKTLSFKNTLFRYLPTTGFFIGSPVIDDDELIESVLRDTMVVDEYNFGYGFVPEHFSGVAGYRACLESEI